MKFLDYIDQLNALLSKHKFENELKATFIRGYVKIKWDSPFFSVKYLAPLFAHLDLGVKLENSSEGVQYIFVRGFLNLNLSKTCEINVDLATAEKNIIAMAAHAARIDSQEMRLQEYITAINSLFLDKGLKYERIVVDCKSKNEEDVKIIWNSLFSTLKHIKSLFKPLSVIYNNGRYFISAEPESANRVLNAESIIKVNLSEAEKIITKIAHQDIANNIARQMNDKIQHIFKKILGELYFEYKQKNQRITCISNLNASVVKLTATAQKKKNIIAYLTEKNIAHTHSQGERPLPSTVEAECVEFTCSESHITIERPIQLSDEDINAIAEIIEFDFLHSLFYLETTTIETKKNISTHLLQGHVANSLRMPPDSLGNTIFHYAAYVELKQKLFGITVFEIAAREKRMGAFFELKNTKDESVVDILSSTVKVDEELPDVFYMLLLLADKEKFQRIMKIIDEKGPRIIVQKLYEKFVEITQGVQNNFFIMQIALVAIMNFIKSTMLDLEKSPPLMLLDDAIPLYKKVYDILIDETSLIRQKEAVRTPVCSATLQPQGSAGAYSEISRNLTMINALMMFRKDSSEPLFRVTQTQTLFTDLCKQDRQMQGSLNWAPNALEPV